MKLQLTVILLVGVSAKLSRAAPTSSYMDNEILNENVSFSEAYARRMKSFMNTSIDPCEDFNAYACGNYPNVIEDLQTTLKRSGLFDIMHLLIDQIDATLQRPHHPNEEYYEELQIAKKFVDTCASASLYPTKSSEEFMAVLKTIGGFPAVDPAWNESAFDWFNMTAHLTRYGVVGFVDETILPVYPFEPFYKLPKLGFGFNVYRENIATNESEGYIYNAKVMRDILEVYGVTGSKANGAIEEVFQILRDISELQAPLLEKDLVRSECFKLTRQQSVNWNFDKWDTLFDIAWGVPDFRVSYVSECPCTWFYNKLDELADKKPRAFANYMALKFLFSMHFKLKSTKFQRRQCVTLVKSAMPVLFSHFYIKEHFTNETAKDVLEMVEELKLSMRHTANKADWLSEMAQLEALEKLKKMTCRIGQITDPTSDIYIKQIGTLNVTDNVPLNTLQLARFRIDQSHYGYLHRSEMKTNTMAYDTLDVVRVRAFYMTFQNNLNLWAGILNPPAYHPSFPKSLKYGSLGYIIGHEIGHGFEGHGFKVSANLSRQTSWLSHKSEKIVEERMKCFVEDYTNFYEPAFDHILNGNRSIDEILSDSIGIKLAFLAYKRVLQDGIKHNGKDFIREETLPGLSLSPEQTFFLGFAQTYCSKYEPKDYWQALYAKHPFDRYRAMGTLKNFDEFSNAFSCPEGSPMNPIQKCSLW